MDNEIEEAEEVEDVEENKRDVMIDDKLTEEEKEKKKKVEEEMRKQGINPEEFKEKVEKFSQMSSQLKGDPVGQEEPKDYDLEGYREYLKDKGVVAPILIIGMDANKDIRYVSGDPERQINLDVAQEVIEVTRKHIEETVKAIKRKIPL